MTETTLVWELMLRGLAVGALVATGLGLWRGARARPAGIAGLLFAASVLAYVLQSSSAIRGVLGPAGLPVHVLALGGVGLFWLFIRTLFEDRPLTPPAFAPYALLTALGLVGWASSAPLKPVIWIVHNLIEVGFATHALSIVARGWRGDLVEVRRRLRGPFLAVVTVYIAVLAAFEIGEEFGIAAAWYPLAGALALALFCLTGAAVFLRADPILFGAGIPAPIAAETIDAGDRLTLQKLAEFMDTGEAWRREGLAIGALAAEVGIPEHRLRRLINDHSGHRNFAAFVNARRIEAAKRALADPANARKPVSAIAFDLGFGSLGPFNRAFKEAAGETPSEWRRNALQSGAPIPENPR